MNRKSPINALWWLQLVWTFSPVGCALLGVGGGSSEETWVRSESYKVDAPNDWSQRERGTSDRAYRLPSGSVATVSSSCNRETEAPLPILTKHLLMGMRNTVTESQTDLEVNGKKALLSKVSSTMDGKHFNLVVAVTVQEKCVFDFMLVSPTKISESEQQGFVSFISSLRVP